MKHIIPASWEKVKTDKDGVIYLRFSHPVDPSTIAHQLKGRAWIGENLVLYDGATNVTILTGRYLAYLHQTHGLSPIIIQLLLHRMGYDIIAKNFFIRNNGGKYDTHTS